MNSQESCDRVLRRDALGRTWTPPEKRESILDEFERSGLKGARFARLAGINYGTFATWVQKRRHAKGQYSDAAGADNTPKASLRLVEAVVGDCPSTQGSSLKVLLPGGASLLIADLAQAKLAAQLLKALGTSC